MALAIGCGLSTSFPLLLALRFGHGLASAALGVVVVAVIRDLFVGDAMAKRMSLIFLMFMIVPMIAPAVGAGITAFTSWRAIFMLFRSEEHTSELQSLMRISYAVFCLKKKNKNNKKKS